MPYRIQHKKVGDGDIVLNTLIELQGACGGSNAHRLAECASLFLPPLYSRGLMQPHSFGHRHLLGIEGLSREDIEHVLDRGRHLCRAEPADR